MDTYFMVFFTLVSLGVLAGVVFAVKSVLKVVRALPSAQRDVNVLPDATTYCLGHGLMPHHRAEFYPTLIEAVGDRGLVAIGVNLGDLLVSVGGTDADQWVAQQRVNRKHVDYVVFAADTLDPVAAVQLVDPSPDEPDWAEQEAMVAQVLEQAGLPMLRVGPEEAGDVNLIRAALAPLWNAPAAGPARLDEAE